MSFVNILFAVFCWITLVIAAISIWALKRREPMNLWNGSKVNSEEMTILHKLNRINGVIWAIFTAATVLAIISTLFLIMAGIILINIICLPGLIILFFAYRYYFNKKRR